MGYPSGIIYALLHAFIRHGKRICSDNTGRGRASWDILCTALSAQDKGFEWTSALGSILLVHTPPNISQHHTLYCPTNAHKL